MTAEKTKEGLVIGRTYNVSYMPTKYLYERTGTLRTISPSSLSFWLEDGEHFFSFNRKFLISITEALTTK